MLGSSGILHAELDADGHQVDVGSAPVKSIGSTTIVSVGASGADVEVDGPLAGADVDAV